MKRIALIVLTLNLSACAFFTPKNIRTALNLTQLTCVIANSFRDVPAEIAKACDVSEDFIPEIDKVLEAQKAAAKMRAPAPSASCPPSASAPAP